MQDHECRNGQQRTKSKLDDMVEANLSGKGVMFGNKEQDDDEENVS